jgi:sensor domain CHASE-containing protein
MVGFFVQNLSKFNGQTKLAIELNDSILNYKTKLETQMNSHFTMNEEMAQFLQNHPNIHVVVDIN